MSAPHFRAGNSADPQHNVAPVRRLYRHPRGTRTSRSNPRMASRSPRVRLGGADRQRGLGRRLGAGARPDARGWMDAQPYAYQCPPLTVANQWGWQVLCPTDVAVAWNGAPDPAGVRVKVDPRFSAAIKSQFGQGIVTFGPPWLFRTSAGWDLLAKGPSNHWKANCVRSKASSRPGGFPIPSP